MKHVFESILKEKQELKQFDEWKDKQKLLIEMFNIITRNIYKPWNDDKLTKYARYKSYLNQYGVYIEAKKAVYNELNNVIFVKPMNYNSDSLPEEFTKIQQKFNSACTFRTCIY